MRFTRGIEYGLALLSVYIVYVAAAIFGLVFHIGVSGSITLLWVPSGLAVAVLLAWGNRFAPAVVLASFTVNALTGDASVLSAAAIALGNTAEYLLVAYVARRMLASPPNWEQRIARLSWVGAGVALGCAFAATVGSSALYFQDALPYSAYWQGWSGWWAGDALGILIFAAPCYLLLSQD